MRHRQIDNRHESQVRVLAAKATTTFEARSENSSSAAHTTHCEGNSQRERTAHWQAPVGAAERRQDVELVVEVLVGERQSALAPHEAHELLPIGVVEILEDLPHPLDVAIVGFHTLLVASVRLHTDIRKPFHG